MAEKAELEIVLTDRGPPPEGQPVRGPTPAPGPAFPAPAPVAAAPAVADLSDRERAELRKRFGAAAADIEKLWREQMGMPPVPPPALSPKPAPAPAPPPGPVGGQAPPPGPVGGQAPPPGPGAPPPGPPGFPIPLPVTDTPLLNAVQVLAAQMQARPGPVVAPPPATTPPAGPGAPAPVQPPAPVQAPPAAPAPAPAPGPVVAVHDAQLFALVQRLGPRVGPAAGQGGGGGGGAAAAGAGGAVAALVMLVKEKVEQALKAPFQAAGAVMSADMGQAMRGLSEFVRQLPGGHQLGGIGGAVMNLSDAAMSSAQNLARFNGSIAMQLAELNVSRVQRQIERAQDPEIAQRTVETVQKRQEFEEKLQEVLDEALPVFLELASALMDLVKSAMPAIKIVVDVLTWIANMVKAILDWLNIADIRPSTTQNLNVAQILGLGQPLPPVQARPVPQVTAPAPGFGNL